MKLRKCVMFSIMMVSMQFSIAATRMLSTQKDTKDSKPSSAVKSKSDVTSFWGLSNMLGGTKAEKAVDVDTAVSIVKEYVGKDMANNFNEAAFLISIRKRGDVIAALAESSLKVNTALAAAAMAVGVTGDFIQKEREDERIHIEHFDAIGVKIDLGGAVSDAEAKTPVKGKKGKSKRALAKNRKRGRGKVKLNFKGLVAPAVLTKLLASEDPLTLYYAIQAAAYVKNKSVNDSIAALEDSTGKIAAAKLFYKAMIGDPISKEEILAAANKAGKEKSKRGFGKEVYLPVFSLDQPGLCFVCRAIGVSGNQDGVPVLIKCLSGAPNVQSDAAWALAKLKPEEALPALSKAVATAPWTSLVPICKAIGKIPSEKMIPSLIERLSKEKGRVRLDLTHALAAIVGGQMGCQTADGWKKWWSENKATFKVDPASSEKYLSSTRPQDVDILANGVFYNLYIYSDHFSYVVDSSLSMKGDRIASLKVNLTDSVLGLKNFVYYNIVDFGGDVEAIDNELINSNSKGKQRVYDMDMSLATRSFCALRVAMRIPETDTIYFLSDGAPVYDSMKNWADIRRAVLMMTRYAPVAVYSIDFDPSKQNQIAMINLADENFGVHESIIVDAAPEGFDMGGAKVKPKRKKK